MAASVVLLCEAYCIRIHLWQSILHTCIITIIFSVALWGEMVTLSDAMLYQSCPLSVPAQCIRVEIATLKEAAQMKSYSINLFDLKIYFHCKFSLDIALRDETCNCILFQTIDEHNICQKRMLFTQKMRLEMVVFF